MDDLELDLPYGHWLADAIQHATEVGDMAFVTVDVPNPRDGGPPQRRMFAVSRWEVTRDGRHGKWSQVKITLWDHLKHVEWIRSMASWPALER